MGSSVNPLLTQTDTSNNLSKVSTSSTSTDDTTSTGSSSLDKNTFLNLLVTQMKYQDPLNPSDSTEYMSQLAQFTSLEEMENLNTKFATSSSQDLVGKYVIMKTEDANGSTSYVSGMVDYMMMQNSKPYLSINGSLYDYDDLDSVVDEEYMEALASSTDTE